ncbi:hypothetical protein Emag_000411 [Eimeria magna]
MVNEPTLKPSSSPKAAALSAAAPPAAAAAARPQRSDVHWDAAASTCVSGSEGSLPHSVRNQQQEKRVQQQQSRQRQSEGPLMEASNSEGSDMHSMSPPNPIDQSPQPYLQHEQQQQSSALVAAGGSARFQAARSQAGSDSSDSGQKSPPTDAATSAAALVPVAQIRRGKSSSSSCSSMSIGAELKGLIAALGATDTAGSNELQQQLQQLLAERDLYKAAFGAAKEELKASSARNTYSSNSSSNCSKSSKSSNSSSSYTSSNSSDISNISGAAISIAKAAGEPLLAASCGAHSCMAC